MSRKVKTPPPASKNLAADVVRLANRLASLQRKRREQLRAIRETNGLMRQTRRELKALVQSLAEPDPMDQMPPTRFES